ncbi:MAG: gliding motility-associated C-terminal domain-containing protein [Paludibacteraceae bacterium]|nr:gliding motility-associated C-terminal domain-containing protein [Paludibacteraceae bacterium]
MAWEVPNEVFLCQNSTSVDINISSPGLSTSVYEWFSDEDCKTKIGEGTTYTASATYEQKSIYVRRKGTNNDVREVKVGKLDWVGINQIKQGNEGCLCKGGSVELTPFVGYSGRINNESFNQDANTETLAYEWIYDGARVGRTEKYNAEQPGTYTLKFSTNGCQVEQTVVVAAKKELLRLTGADQLCNGGSLVIEVGGMDTYQWTGAVAPIEGNKKVKISTPGEYKVVGSSNIGGCKDSLSFTIKEKEALDVKIDGIYALCPGSTSTTLTALVEGVPNETLRFEWTDGYGNTMSNNANITIEEIGTYNVVVSDGNCNGGNTTTVLNVNNVGAISVQPEDVIICAGYAKTVTARGDNLVKFKWFDSLGNEVNGKTQDQVELKKEGNYSVIGYTKEGCPSERMQFPTRVVDNPSLIVPDLKPCVGDEPELMAQFADSLNFQWVVPTPNEYLNSREKTIKISKDGTYKARVTDLTTRCQTNAETTIKFLGLPEITGPDKAEICEGGSTSLSFTTVKNGKLTGTLKSYIWTDSNGVKLSADSFLVVSEPGKYYFSADNAYGCTTTKEVTVTTKPKPKVAITKDKDYLCGEGEKATFSASGTDISSYKWTYGNNQQFTKPDFPVSTAGPYKLQVTGKNGCVFDTVVSIETKSKVKIDTIIPDFCKGESGKIIVKSSKESDYEWSDGTKSDTIEVTESGDYTVKVTDREFHCSQNVTVPVVVHENPTISLDPVETSFCKGKSATLSVSVTNPVLGKYSISWDNSSSTSSSLTVDKAGTYQVTVTDNEYHCKSTASAEVVEKALPVVDLKSDQDTVCKGDEVTLTASGADSYTWKRNGENLNTQKATYSENPQDTSEFTIVGKDNNTGCESEPVSKEVVVSNPFTISIEGEPNICEGQEFEAMTASGADRFEWYDGENKVGLTAEYTPTKAGKFTVKGFKTNNICEVSKEIETRIESYLQIETPKDTFFCDGEEITVEANGADSYEWTIPSGSIQKKQNLTISESGKYKVTGISRTGCKSLPVDFNVEKKEIPTVTIEGKAVMCSGKNSTMKAVGNGGSEPYTYNWTGEMEFSAANSIDIEQGGTYKVIVKDKFGCTADASKTVTVASPKVSIEGKDQFCTDSTLTLTAKGDAKKYFWNSSTENKATFTTGEPGTVSLVGEDENGCLATAILNVSKRAIPVLEVKDTTYYCEHSSIDLVANMDSVAKGYVWNNASLVQKNTYNVNTEQTVKVIGYDTWNCPSKPRDMIVKETKVPDIVIEGDTTACLYGDSIVLNVAVKEGNPEDIIWNNGKRGKSIKVKDGKYTAYATVSVCKSLEVSHKVDLITNAKIDIKGVDEICTDSFAVLTASSTEKLDYVWEDHTTNKDTIIVKQTGTYRVEGTDKYGCKSKAEKNVNQRDIPQLSIAPTAAYCENDSIKLVATLNREASYYVWDKGALQPKNYKYANQVRDYTVMAYDNIMCPSNTSTVAVAETKIPVVKIEGPTYVCQNGDPITLTAQVEGAHDRYEWNTQETTESISVQYGGQYIAKAFVGVCSSEPDTFDVEYKLIPKLSIMEGAKTTYCDLLSVTLHAESPTAVSYRWEPEGVATPENEVNTEGFHTVFVEDKFGCKNQDSIETEVIYGPEINIKGDTTLCEFSISEIQLDCPDCVSQTWSTGEKTTSITVYESGFYQVEGIGPNGCPSRAEHHLNVTPAPSLEIEGETEITSNDSTTLTAIAEGAEPFRFYWTPTHEMSQSITVHSDDIDQWQNYTAMVYDKNNCYNFQTVLVTKHSVKLNGKKNFCEGDSTVITAVGEGVTGFVWSTGETTPSITIKDAGLYSIISTHENGLIDTLKFEIIVHPLSEVNIVGNLSFCRGDSTFLIAEGNAQNYIWDNGVLSDTIIVREEGKYAVSAISTYGCVSRDSVNVVVFELPDVQIVGPDTVLEESSIILKAEGAISYHWEKPDTISETIEVYEGGRYKTIGTDEHNCRNIAIHDVRTIPIPHPLINDTTNGHAIACIDDKVALIASGAETYLWDTGETNDTIYVTESRIYTVTGCLSNGQCRENHYSVEFSPHPRMMKIEGATKICADSFSVLTAYSFNDTLISHFVWSTGEETQSVKVRDTSEYSVSAVSKYGCLSDTMSVSLTYYPYPEPFITGIPEVCKDSETRLKANGGERYLWVETGEETEFISVSTPGKQVLRAWNEFGCSADSFIYVEDRGEPVISIRGKKGVCEGYNTTISAEGIQFKENYYLWNTGDTTSSIVVDKAGEYNVVVTNRSGCVATDTLQFVIYPNPVIEIDGSDFVCIDDSTLLKSKQISGNKIDKYSWNTGETDSVEYVNATGEYTLQVIDIHECYSNIATHETKMRVPNPIAVTGDFDICNEQKDTATVKAYSVGAAFYSWVQNTDTLLYGNPEFSVNRKGMYRVVSTDSFGCRSYKDVEIIGHNAPLVKITGAEIPVCGPETAELRSASESDVVKFLWNTGETTAEITSDHSGDFWMRGTDIYGCIATDTVHLILNDIPGMKIEGDLGLCPNDETDIKVVGAETYIWSNGSTGEHTSFHEAGDYSVKGTDKYGCEKEIIFHVKEYFVPEVMLVESPTKISRIDPTVNFSAVSFDDLSNTYFIWSMGDDETVEERSFDYTFDIAKQRWFKVVMAVHTTDGCTYNREVVLPVDLYIPNTITPNGDGINDVFMKGFEVEIFDRHGERLFYGHDGWDGHLKDGSIVADTYYYVLTDITGDIYRGYITVKK